MLEYWNAGMLECWNAGMLECWNTGILEYWNTGILECWNAGMLECWDKCKCWYKINAGMPGSGINTYAGMIKTEGRGQKVRGLEG